MPSLSELILDPAEAQLLAIVGEREIRPQDWATGRPVRSTRDALLRRGELLLGERRLDWDAAFESLVARGILERHFDTYVLADRARPQVTLLRRELAARIFGERLCRAAASPAYGELSDRVLGPGLRAFSLVDPEQMDALIEGLALEPDQRALDVGCGLGTLTESVAAATGAHLTGIDLASSAIAMAIERCRNDDRLSFSCGDAQDLEPVIGPFDAIMAVDSLYFMDDLDATVARLRELIKSTGRLAALVSDVLPEEISDRDYPAENTTLGRVLARQGFSFSARSFTENERAIWERQLVEAGALAGRFAAEGNKDLCDELIREAERTLGWCEGGRVRRFLFVAQPV